MADAPMIFQFIGDAITSAMNAYVNSTAPAVIGQITGVAVTATTVYYVWMGYMTALGRLDGPLSAVVLSAIKFAIIAALALSAGNYLSYVVTSVNGLETSLAEAFSGSQGTKPQNVYQLLDNSLKEGWDLAGQVWERAGQRGLTEVSATIGDYLVAFIIAAATIIIATPAGAMIVLAKTILQLLLGIGPLFIMCLMWSPTKAFFDRWVGAVVTALFQIALLCAVLAFALKLFNATVAATDVSDGSGGSPLFAALTLIVLTIVMLWLLYQVNNKAAELAGGVSSAAVTLGQLARGTMGAVTSPGRAANAILNPVSTRRDLQSGMMVSAGRLNHLAAGNTAWNPRYMQHVMQNLGRNWGWREGGRVAGQ